MFKDYDKYLSTSLKVYLFVLVIIFILKLVGLDYFALDINNAKLIEISNFCIKWKLDIIYSYINCFIYYFVILTISTGENSKKIRKYILLTFPFIIILQYLKIYINNTLFNIFYDFIYLLIFIIIYKKTNKKIIGRYFKIAFISVLFQIISIIIRQAPRNTEEYNFLISFICNLDYTLLNLIAYKLYFMKGGSQCYQVVEVSLSSLKKLNLKNLLTKLRKNYHNFKKQDRVTKLTYIIYFIFSLIWNTLSVIVILLVAKLNDTFIECIFILTSFWLSKKSFGKAFHLSSMSKCFIVSNLSYYILNRITTPLGISIIVPILLGVGLSYVTSKLVKKTYKTLYRGMPEELFEETILKVVDKNSLKYKICYDFYIKNKSIISLAIKYNYTESGIRKIKDRVNEKIKRLN